MSDFTNENNSVGNEIKENVCRMQLCYESNEIIEFSMPVDYARCQMYRWSEEI